MPDWAAMNNVAGGEERGRERKKEIMQPKLMEIELRKCCLAKQIEIAIATLH